MQNESPIKIKLDSNWLFALGKSPKNKSLCKDVSLKNGKYLKAEVPGTIHTDLIKTGIIDDPFYADNELNLEWISKLDWVYKTTFKIKGKKNYNLMMNGIDTIADVYINNKIVTSCSNMFISYKIDIEKYLKQGTNELKIYFHSPVKYAGKEEKKYGKLPVALNSSRVYIRKAQYSFGWDWGPSFPTSGIYRDLYLEEKKEAKIEYILFNTKSIKSKKAIVSSAVSLKTKTASQKKILIKLKSSNATYIKEISALKSGIYKTDFEILNPKLWWPVNEGEQNLYALSISVLDKENNTIDHLEKNVGIRKIDLIKRENGNNTFKIRVNGKDIFAKGVNWIPADSFLPRVTKEKYSELLSLTKEANMNIVRVWGGGLYENEEFYELCDSLGLLVWQDFMFACGAYPENKSFLENVKEEIKQNTERLQHHASIAVWCGNNENEWNWYQEQKSSYKKMPGYKTYHTIIPGILKSIDPSLNYWPSSPFSYEADPNSFNAGNTHQWDIWSRWVDYENVINDKSLFVTEFGFQGPANKDTYEKYLPKDNRKINDRVFEFHNKQIEGPERIMKFMSAHLPVNTNWNDYLYLAQLNQGLALKTCLEYWRTNGRTNGSIIWQINDCWPVASWAIVDSELKPKSAYHFVKNSFSQQIVYFSSDKSNILLIAQNQNREKFNGKIKVYIVDAPSGKIKKKLLHEITIGANSNRTFDSFNENIYKNNSTLIFAELYDQKGKVISSNYYKNLPWKHYSIAEAEISIKIIDRKEKTNVVVSSNKPAYFVDLYAKDCDFSKRCFTIFPGNKLILDVNMKRNKKLKASDIKLFSLNKYLK